MALSFAKTNGSAIKSNVESYKVKDGENTLRMVGGILPRYMYWVKGTNDKQIPAECLGFDRDQEKFTNKEVDHVQSYYPELKCQWSYSVNCIDPSDGKVKVFNLKKKLFAAICSAAEDLALDPTDPDTGFDIIFKKVKTGPLAYNVEYTLSQLKLKSRALTEDERAAVAASPTIDAKFPRPTPDDIKALLDKLAKGVEDETTKSSGIDNEAINELG